jgi:hypothetical protein
MNEEGTLEEIREYTLLGVSFVAEALHITVFPLHLVVNNPFRFDQWALGTGRWFVDIGPIQLWVGR